MEKSRVIIVTPIAPFTIIPPVQFDFPRLISEMQPFSVYREVNINANRAKLHDHIRTRLSGAYDYVILMDSDVVVTQENLSKLFDYIEPGKTPCICTKPTTATDHVVTSCALLCMSDYLKVNYMTSPTQCQCHKLPNPFYIPDVTGTEV